MPASPPPPDPERELAARRARPVLALLAATLAVGIALLVLFDPDVQTVDAAQLVERRGDARAFLVADYVFVALYAILSPIALWRFGAAVGGGAAPAWIVAAALVLAAAGVVDAVENTLLAVATGGESQDTVDAAHALAVPKVALFSAGALLALAVNLRALRALRGGG